MTGPDPALLGTLVVAAVGVAIEVYVDGGIRLAGRYEKERKKFYDDNWQKCRNLDDLACVEFTRSLVTSNLWSLVTSSQHEFDGTNTSGPAVVRQVEDKIRVRTEKLRAELELLLTQFRSRTGNKEKLERVQELYTPVRAADTARLGCLRDLNRGIVGNLRRECLRIVRLHPPDQRRAMGGRRGCRPRRICCMG